MNFKRQRNWWQWRVHSLQGCRLCSRQKYSVRERSPTNDQ